jgi:hypothetical protein
MSDAGEGLVDAEARLQEQMDEREQERRRRSLGGAVKDPERERALASLRLAKAQLEQQLQGNPHPVRRQQLELAMKDIEKRLKEYDALGVAIKGEEERLLKMMEIRAAVTAELSYLSSFEVNVYETRETVLRRQRQLRLRLAELGLPKP